MGHPKSKIHEVNRRFTPVNEAQTRVKTLYHDAHRTRWRRTTDPLRKEADLSRWAVQNEAQARDKKNGTV